MAGFVASSYLRGVKPVSYTHLMIDCYQVFDNNTIKPVKAQIHHLKPIEYDEYKDLKTPEIAALVQSRIQACMDEYC